MTYSSVCRLLLVAAQSPLYLPLRKAVAEEEAAVVARPEAVRPVLLRELRAQERAPARAVLSQQETQATALVAQQEAA